MRSKRTMFTLAGVAVAALAYGLTKVVRSKSVI